MADQELISWVRGVQIVSNDEGAQYILAWGENGNSIEGCGELRQREDSCDFDFVVTSGPLTVITPAAAIARFPEEVICLQICVYGKDGPVCLPWAKNK